MPPPHRFLSFTTLRALGPLVLCQFKSAKGHKNECRLEGGLSTESWRSGRCGCPLGAHPALGNQDGVMIGVGAIYDQQEATQIGALQDFRGRRVGLVNPTRWVLERGRKNEMRDPL